MLLLSVLGISTPLIYADDIRKYGSIFKERDMITCNRKPCPIWSITNWNCYWGQKNPLFFLSLPTRTNQIYLFLTTAPSKDLSIVPNPLELTASSVFRLLSSMDQPVFSSSYFWTEGRMLKTFEGSKWSSVYLLGSEGTMYFIPKYSTAIALLRSS